MKSFWIGVMIVALSAIPNAFSDSSDDWDYSKGKSTMVASSNAELLDMDMSEVKGTLRNIQRRLDELERENRFQDEKIRNLDRSVVDLKRRRVS